MKKILSTALVLFLFLSGPVYARSLSGEEKTSIQTVIHEMIQIDAVKIGSPAVEKIFAGTFYTVKPAMKIPDGTIGMGKLLLAKVNDRFGQCLVAPKTCRFTGRANGNYTIASWVWKLSTRNQKKVFKGSFSTRLTKAAAAWWLIRH